MTQILVRRRVLLTAVVLVLVRTAYQVARTVSSALYWQQNATTRSSAGYLLALPRTLVMAHRGCWSEPLISCPDRRRARPAVCNAAGEAALL